MSSINGLKRFGLKSFCKRNQLPHPLYKLHLKAPYIKNRGQRPQGSKLPPDILAHPVPTRSPIGTNPFAMDGLVEIFPFCTRLPLLEHPSTHKAGSSNTFCAELCLFKHRSILHKQFWVGWGQGYSGKFWTRFPKAGAVTPPVCFPRLKPQRQAFCRLHSPADPLLFVRLLHPFCWCCRVVAHDAKKAEREAAAAQASKAAEDEEATEDEERTEDEQATEDEGVDRRVGPAGQAVKASKPVPGSAKKGGGGGKKMPKGHPSKALAAPKPPKPVVVYRDDVEEGSGEEEEEDGFSGGLETQSKRRAAKKASRAWMTLGQGGQEKKK
eukprot:928851-Pelagomonas_calceolata.AAC.1